MIPKVIHYCWLSNDEIPADLQQCMDTWQEKLSDYEFIKWDFTKFDKNSSAWVGEAFDNKKYAFACDYIRLFALYNYGGIYMDMDIEVLKKFDSLLNREYMMAKERPDQVWIEAGCMGAEKGASFIKDCLEYYTGRHFINDDGVFEDTPLPQIMSKVYLEKGYKFNLMEWQTFTCKSYKTGEISKTEDSYTVHHFAGSWKDKEEQAVYKKALKIRNGLPVIGGAVAFVYEKGYKTKSTLNKGGLKEFVIRTKRFLTRD